MTSVRVGGFSRVPSRADLESLRPELEQALEDAQATARWVRDFDYPAFEREPALLALRDGTGYSLDDGRIVTSDGLELSPADWETVFEEVQVAHSTALVTRRPDGRHYLLGPAARVVLAGDRLHLDAAAALVNEGCGSRAHWIVRGRDIRPKPSTRSFELEQNRAEYEQR